MRILLDTHILLWAVGNSRRLDARTRAALEDTGNVILFSTASIWEVAVKFALQRPDFVLRPADVLQASVAAGFAELPITTQAACQLAELPLLHRDPFDRLLVAQAIVEPATLYTADEQLMGYSSLVQRVT
jgi:PIN domain nuclease of toxin-antitoxin system